MHRVTSRDLIKGVAQAWKEQYTKYKTDEFKIAGKSTGDIANELDQLNTDTATIQDVTGIIGNHMWVTMSCNECGEQVEDAIRIDPGCDCGSQFFICIKCFKLVLGE